jgi:hypothetical protein
VLLLCQGLKGELVRTEDFPFFVSDQLLKGTRIVDKLVQVAKSLLANAKGNLENLIWD